MKNFLISLRTLAVMTLLTGVLYPLAVTLGAKLIFPAQAGGSLVTVNGKTVGSSLQAQAFAQPKYFWPRPSAVKFDAVNSGASNLSPNAADLVKAVAEREAQGALGDLRFASGSGLDPHISPEAAMGQARRVGEARKINPDDVRHLIEDHTEKRQFGFLGEPRINVLELNLALDKRMP